MPATVLTILRPAIPDRASAFSRLFSRITRHFTHRAAIARLRTLDDRALRDIGLTRCQIEAAVHGRMTAPRPREERVAGN